ncbi:MULTISPECIES: ABC transporter permease [unclassified Plantactinospora]|uniref:ABC transporter permease n=1 Tax=unclassified Plantactinospora TaxID=2631981 RepID=UPI000D17DAA5|nr:MULTISPECIES: ABC transporter permease [unclassified Plantactinospora]AVT33487.1 peptide ABC transporter permease [Plantactinospora sp. BC1]AVT38994.1 peptide ABC transporter permease [Plantactinospora sp. BB1]
MSNVESVTQAEVPSAAGVPVSPDGGQEKPRSLTGDAWEDLRRNWIFWAAAVLVLVVVVMAAFPGLFTSADPDACALSRQHQGPSGSAIFGYNFQGCDVYARTIYGARNSVLIGLFATIIAGVIGLIVGMAAGYFGGWVDALLARGIDIVLGIPTLLAAIVLARRLSSDPQNSGFVAVVFTLGVLTWTTGARIMRSSVISAKNQDYVAAARMLGAGSGRLMFRHILPNAAAPFVVVLTILLGVNISTEATLTFLGVGLRGDAISWGIDISTAAPYVRETATPLVWPSVFLAMTVLAFIMLGDAIRDAFDPRLR